MIELKHLHKRVDGGRWVTNDVNLKIYDNEMTVIIGKSDEGK